MVTSCCDIYGVPLLGVRDLNAVNAKWGLGCYEDCQRSFLKHLTGVGIPKHAVVMP